MSEPTEKCTNPACHCPAQLDTGFCSEYCENAEHKIELGCHCGHAECEQSLEAISPAN
jgi:hypothetical protein